VGLQQFAVLLHAFVLLARGEALLEAARERARALELAGDALVDAFFLARRARFDRLRAERGLDEERERRGGRALGRVRAERFLRGARLRRGGAPGARRRAPRLPDREPRVLLARGRRDEQVEHDVAAPEPHEVRVAAEELEHERAALARRGVAPFEERDAIARDRHDLGERRARELLLQSSEERTERTVVEFGAFVLDVEPRRFRVGGDADPAHAALAVLLQHEHDVRGRQSDDLLHASAAREPVELARERRDLRGVEVQASSSWTL